jgi:hypothetical protein
MCFDVIIAPQLEYNRASSTGTVSERARALALQLITEDATVATLESVDRTPPTSETQLHSLVNDLTRKQSKAHANRLANLEKAVLGQVTGSTVSDSSSSKRKRSHETKRQTKNSNGGATSSASILKNKMDTRTGNSNINPPPQRANDIARHTTTTSNTSHGQRFQAPRHQHTQRPTQFLYETAEEAARNAIVTTAYPFPPYPPPMYQHPQYLHPTRLEQEPPFGQSTPFGQSPNNVDFHGTRTSQQPRLPSARIATTTFPPPLPPPPPQGLQPPRSPPWPSTGLATTTMAPPATAPDTRSQTVRNRTGWGTANTTGPATGWGTANTNGPTTGDRKISWNNNISTTPADQHPRDDEHANDRRNVQNVQNQTQNPPGSSKRSSKRRRNKKQTAKES